MPCLIFGSILFPRHEHGNRVADIGAILRIWYGMSMFFRGYPFHDRFHGGGGFDGYQSRRMLPLRASRISDAKDFLYDVTHKEKDGSCHDTTLALPPTTFSNFPLLPKCCCPFWFLGTSRRKKRQKKKNRNSCWSGFVSVVGSCSHLWMAACLAVIQS